MQTILYIQCSLLRPNRRREYIIYIAELKKSIMMMQVITTSDVNLCISRKRVPCSYMLFFINLEIPVMLKMVCRTRTPFSWNKQILITDYNIGFVRVVFFLGNHNLFSQKSKLTIAKVLKLGKKVFIIHEKVSAEKDWSHIMDYVPLLYSSTFVCTINPNKLTPLQS